MDSSHNCELALPAGSLQCALYAFKGGADAVYVGLKSFSARKGAVNFSFEDVRKLKALCQSTGKKFYIALNTLVSDSELDQVIPLLRQLSYVKPDGLIVQDLGIAKILRDSFPDLPLHASTQLAVHTIEGVRQLQEMGFSRVVLSRELSFKEIEAIRTACPDVEIKVFIHGALCYGFSGLCMASQVITGRSANCGACAQICRTWFSCRETGTDSWLFSMKDLCLGELVRRYSEIGIDSLKIEGRMKGPDYAYWCARYYRMLLDGMQETDQEVKWAKEAMQVAFSRETTTGFFDTGTNGSTNCQNMVCSNNPTHKGIQIGTIDRVLNSKAVVRFDGPVAIRDGLRVIFGTESASFSLMSIDGGKSFISEGETATINFPTSEFHKKPGFGTPVYCVSRHNLNMAELNESLPLFKRPVDLSIRVLENELEINGTIWQVELQEARSQSDLEGIFRKVFEASDKSLFSLGELSVINESTFRSPFVPMSVLKQIRRDFYDRLDQQFLEQLEAPFPTDTACTQEAQLPERARLGLWDKVVDLDGRKYLPLSPVMFREEEYLKSLDCLLEEKPELIIGLNNIAQARWAKKHPNTRFFADIFLYTRNKQAYLNLKNGFPNLIGSYELDHNTPFTYTGDGYVPPLFISRVCLRHNGLGLSCKGCSKDNTFSLEQNGHHYKAICKDCTTIVIQE